MLPDQYHSTDEIQRVKATVRNTMMEARRQKIADSRDFIERVENPSPAMRARVPITALIADGIALARDMEAIAALDSQEEKLAALRTAVRPYLQLVRENEICSHTGHKISDIWRYFRFTWSTPAETTPGRTLLYLIRDAARPYHPIMGLASLENASIKIKDRDDYIHWTFDAFKLEVETAADDKAVRESFGRLLGYIQVALKDISIEGLCTEKERENPTPRLLQKLAAIAARSVQEREVALREWGERDEDSDDSIIERSELGNISRAAVDALYRRKRAEQLGRLLSARRALQNILGEPNFSSRWHDFLNSESGQTAIRAAFLAQKSRHVGTSILELNVCGAIPPYNELLAGKLVALVALSPHVVSDYRQRYGNRPSDIASRLKGENVIRPAELVFLGTTSLYRAGTSQYNRLKLPAGLLCSGAPAVRWERLGETTGYGTLHISRLTLQCLEEVENEGGVSLINNIFGEGPSPKLRLIRQGITDIFEPGQRDVLDELTKHSMGRLVYGAWLAVNGRAYLNGSIDHPTYYFDQSLDPIEGTERIVDYWRERWLLPRLNYQEALDRVAAFRPESLYVSKDVPKKEEIRYKLISAEVAIMTEWAANDQGTLRNFLRNLYRGSSAYADYMDSDRLNSIHVDTGLDKAIVDAVSEGKSIVLTGNPGDGKMSSTRKTEH